MKAFEATPTYKSREETEDTRELKNFLDSWGYKVGDLVFLNKEPRIMGNITEDKITRGDKNGAEIQCVGIMVHSFDAKLNDKKKIILSNTEALSFEEFKRLNPKKEAL
jgi:hypothetical protein